MNRILYLLLLILVACTPKPQYIITPWVPYDETEELAANESHESTRMQYKLIQSKFLDKNDIWKSVQNQILYFTEADYLALSPLIFEQNIPAIQQAVQEGQLTYEQLVQWYLFRIVKFENDSNTTLHTIISINPNAVAEAREKDRARAEGNHPLFGMPILLKDNIGTTGMPTTAGAHVLKDNETSDAFIVERIKDKGGIILGKVNLSEWAYYFCSGCPVGYSAIGGQTLNPYGRMVFETGGSSSGSGTSMAASYAVAAVGTETSGSILSPSSANSVVGLKPTIGLLSRDGIVPISSTLDTPGPMTRSVTDNAILLSAMTGKDAEDGATKAAPDDRTYWQDLSSASLEGLRLGANAQFMEDSLYLRAIEQIQAMGAEVITFEPEQVNFTGFRTFLNADMQNDLPKYLADHASDHISIEDVAGVIQHNLEDTLKRSPYGQALLEGVVAEDITAAGFDSLKDRFLEEATRFFETPIETHNLDAILSINNWNAGHAAMAKYPCLTVPMGYLESGQPRSLTFIGRPWTEDQLLRMGYAYEQQTLYRKYPSDYPGGPGDF